MMYHAKARFSSTTGLEDIYIGQSHVEWKGEKLTEDAFSWQSPVVGTVYGTLLNFQEQVDALKEDFHKAPYNKPPERPVLYIKPRNTINAHLKEVAIPKEAEMVEVNGTLGVVIGKTATHVKEEDALDYVEGYTIVNDVSIPHRSFYRPAIKQKARDGFCPIGPWIVLKENVPDPDNIMIWTFKNDELIQVNSTKDLVRSIPRLIQDISEYMTLAKGDLLLVGIPHDPPTAKAGDTIRIEIDHIGSLENRFVYENVRVAGGEKV
ncbi:fumarylacetoacetate hydrolase family protein [Ornithinibacillus californiensis]|uniref:fumarylacetoacetate hydrolase family protein n=1 Tax=Ornithinibacillus californiensis TaxID=161536 RepID=UPI00069F7E59|nr:fumarylacetoacetate hydrolase family protein [Ornithinibacillus californiensis]